MEHQKEQELMMKLQMFEQQLNNLARQLQAVEEAVVEMNNINFGLDELKGSEGKEIFSPLGRGVFAKTKLVSEELLVDVGEKNFVKKSIPETKEIIETQIGKLEEMKTALRENLEATQQEMTNIFQEAQNSED